MKKTFCKTVTLEPRYFKDNDEWEYFLKQLGYDALDALKIEEITIACDVKKIFEWE